MDKNKSDEFSGIERLLGLPQGSTKKIDPNEAGKYLAKGVVKKTNSLDKELKKTGTLEKMAKVDLIKSGISVELLEKDKEKIRTEAFELYRIAKTLLDKYMEDVNDRIDVDDRMYSAGFKGIDSLSGTLDKLSNIILKFKQEAEFKEMASEETIDSNKKLMSPEQWTEFIEFSKKETEKSKEVKETRNIQDAEIIEPDN